MKKYKSILLVILMNISVSFSQDSNRLAEANVFSIYQVFNTDIIYAATSLGLFRSDNNGENWSLFGFNGKSVTAVGSFIDKETYAWIKNEGLFQTSDMGKTWKNIKVVYYPINSRGVDVLTEQYSFEVFNIYCNIDDEDEAIMIDFKYDMTRHEKSSYDQLESFNKGESWTWAGDSWSGIKLRRAINRYNEEPEDAIDAIIESFVGTKRISEKDAKLSIFQWNSSIKKEDEDTIYILTKYGLIRSDYEGENQVNVTLPVKENEVTTLYLDWRKSNTIFIGTNKSGVFKSDDAGITWKSPFADVIAKKSRESEALASEEKLKPYNLKELSSINVYDICLTEYPRILLATSSGIFESNDKGKNWKKDETLNKEVKSINVLTGNITFASVEGEGIYRYAKNKWEKLDVTYPIASYGAIHGDIKYISRYKETGKAAKYIFCAKDSTVLIFFDQKNEHGINEVISINKGNQWFGLVHDFTLRGEWIKTGNLYIDFRSSKISKYFQRPEKAISFVIDFISNEHKISENEAATKIKGWSKLVKEEKSDNDLVFVATEYGLYKTCWNCKEVSTVPLDKITVSCLSVEYNPENPDIIFVGTTGHGIFISEDGGKTWFGNKN